MRVLGIETSCDECAAGIVEDGRLVLSNIIASQIPFHAPYNGVVPEIASRKHTEWIYDIVKEALDKANTKPDEIDAVAVTNRPGLLGSLIVGMSFAKAFSWAQNIPFIAIDHMLAHLYASQLYTPETASIEQAAYPFLGLLVSGGHTIICKAEDFDRITVLGATIDDAAGEAFDKIAKHYKFGYPGGAVIDRMAKTGNASAFNFPIPSLHKNAPSHRYDVSYSGLKNAAINQTDIFIRGEGLIPRCLQRNNKKQRRQVKGINPETNSSGERNTQRLATGYFISQKGSVIKPEDIAASFQKTAVEILLRALFNAVEDTGLKTIVLGGGVAANSYLRSRLAERKDLHCLFPPAEFCGDNGAMIAGIAYHYLLRGERSPLSVTASARVEGFKRMMFTRGK